MVRRLVDADRYMVQFSINRIPPIAVLCALAILGSVCEVDAEQVQIGIIDLYGLNRMSAADVRKVLTFKEGDTISLVNDERPVFLTESEHRLARLPGVVRARTQMGCCDQGRAMIHVGIEELGAGTTHFRAAPTGTARLAADIVQAGDEFSNAFAAAVQRGDASEDRSQGQAFAHDPATRAVQERFV